MHDGHRGRMREKFEKYGDDIFENHELLEMLLFFPIARKNTNELAHKLINRFGSLRGVFDADFEELCEVEGIGASTAFYMGLISSAIKRYSSPEDDKRIKLDSYSKVREYLTGIFSGSAQERMYVICLSGNMRVINCEQIAVGSSTGLDAKIGKVVKCVFDNNAALAVLAHNHPNGIAVPSAEDIDATLRLAEIFRYVDCKLIDHFVVAGERCTPILNGNMADFEKLYDEKVNNLVKGSK